MNTVSRLRFQNTPDFSFRGVLKSSGRPFTSPIYEKCRPRKNIKKRKKKCRRVSDIKKILVMSSRPTSIIWIGYHGYILGDIDPGCGSFADTSCVSRGKQLMDLTTKYRNLDQLMSRVNASGSHSTGQECKVPLQNARSWPRTIVVLCTHSAPQFHRSGSLVLWDGMGA